MKHHYYHHISLLFILASSVDAQVSPCIICPNGVTAAEGVDHMPWADIGDTRTCAELIDAAMLVQAGTVACGWYELDKVHCCYTEPVNPCDICLNGDTEAYDDFQPFSQLGDPSTCDSLYDNGNFVETESDLCDVLGTYCCPSVDLTTLTPAVTPQVDPCIVCPNGVTAVEGEDFAPYAGSGDFTTCAEFIEAYKLIDSGSLECGLSDLTVGVYCCYSEPLNPCSICPNGVTASQGENYAPQADDGDPTTCAQFIEGVRYFESGSFVCGYFEVYELACCPTEPENPCIICPDGATVGGDFVPITGSTCDESIGFATLFETESSYCAVLGAMDESDCCPSAVNPPPTPVISSPTPVPVDDTPFIPGGSVVNPCIVCPNGVTASIGEDFAPYAGSGDFTTCAELIETYKQYESETGECEMGDMLVEFFCCYTEPQNPCTICPNGITAAQGDSYAPYAESGDLTTCAQFNEMAPYFESGSYVCGSFEINELACCFTAPENPCIICPDGATVGDDFVPSLGLTCDQLINASALFESSSSFCGAHGEMVELDCCPSVVNPPPTPVTPSPTPVPLIDTPPSSTTTTTTSSTLAAEVDNPCVICPDGATAEEDFIPNASNGNSMTCTELIDKAMTLDAGSQTCAFSKIYQILCCPPPAIAPSPDTIEATMTTTTASTLDSGVDNPCIICSEGTDFPDYPPYAANGDSRTCADLIDEAKQYESGTEDCGYAEFYELRCCYSEPANPCIICPDGVTATGGEEYIPEYDGNTYTCANLIEGAMNLESGSDACALYDIDVEYCCPADALPENMCIICPDGPSTGLDDYIPYANDGNSRTCADLIDEAKQYESGTEDCGYAEFYELQCCYSEPVNPCIICPDGVTASLGDDFVPEYEGNTLTCADLSTDAMRFESGSDACVFAYAIDVAFCCPPEAEETPTPTPLPVDDTTTSTTTTSSTSAAVDPCIICPNGATAGYEDVQPGGAGETKTCKEMLEGMTNVTAKAGSDLCESMSEIEALCCPVVPSKSPTSSTMSSGGVSVPGKVGLVLSIISTLCVMVLA